MRRGYSRQFNCPSVIIDGAEDEEEVIRYARLIGATHHKEGGERFILEFRHAVTGRVGPEMHNEQVLRYLVRLLNPTFGRT